MADRILRWAGPAFVAVLIVKLVSLGAQPLDNADGWWHLRLGHLLGWPWQWADAPAWNGFATADWYPTQPIPELALAAADSAAGLTGVMWLYAAVLVAFTLTLYHLTRTRSTPLVAGVVSSATVLACASGLSVRPQVVGLIIVAWVLHLWLLTIEDGRARWMVVPLVWLAAMCHGYWIVCGLIGGLATAGLIISGSARGRDAAKLVGLCVATGVAVLLTPIGWHVYEAPLVIRDRTFLITEWQRTSWSQPVPYEVLALLLAAVIPLLMKRRLTPAHGLLLASSLFWLIYAERSTDVAAVIAAPMAAMGLAALTPSTTTAASGHRRETALLGGVAAAALALLAVISPSAAAGTGPHFPAGLTRQIDALPEGTVVFDDVTLGGWLEYEFPHVDVVVDGLFDAYPVEHLVAAQRTTYALGDWQSFLDETGATAAVVKTSDPLDDALIADGWTVTGKDRGFTLLVRP